MSMIPDFTKVPFAAVSGSEAAPATEPVWRTPEGIDVKPVYTGGDLAGT